MAGVLVVVMRDRWAWAKRGLTVVMVRAGLGLRVCVRVGLSIIGF